MQANKLDWRKFGIPLAIIVAVALVVAFSNNTKPMPNGLPIVASESDYQASLQTVLGLTHDGVASFNSGQELDQKEKDDLTRAAGILDNMNALKQSEAAGYFESGLIYYIIGDSDAANSRIQQALANAELTPNLATPAAQANLEGVLADAHQILSLIAFDHHDYPKAMKEANEGVKIMTDNQLKHPNIFVARAKTEIELKDLAAAHKDVDKALAMQPTNPQALKLNDFLHHLEAP